MLLNIQCYFSKRSSYVSSVYFSLGSERLYDNIEMMTFICWPAYWWLFWRFFTPYFLLVCIHRLLLQLNSKLSLNYLIYSRPGGLIARHWPSKLDANCGRNRAAALLEKKYTNFLDANFNFYL